MIIFFGGFPTLDFKTQRFINKIYSWPFPHAQMFDLTISTNRCYQPLGFRVTFKYKSKSTDNLNIYYNLLRSIQNVIWASFQSVIDNMSKMQRENEAPF